MPWAELITYGVILCGSAATIAYTAAAAQWARERAHALTILEALTSAWWGATVLIYTLSLGWGIRVEVVGHTTVRPMIAILAVIAITKSILRYRHRELERVRIDAIMRRAQS